MQSLKCRWLTVYYTLRYVHLALPKMMYLSGHSFVDNDEIHEDHWTMKCTRCGFIAASEIKP